MKEYKYLPNANALIIDVSGTNYEYQRSDILVDMSGVIESGLLFNEGKYLGKIFKYDSYVRFTVYPDGDEYYGTDVKSAVAKYINNI